MQLYIEKEIDGKEGGKSFFREIYENYYGDTVTVTATLEVPKDAYTGIKNNYDDEQTIIHRQWSFNPAEVLTYL